MLATYTSSGQTDSVKIPTSWFRAATVELVQFDHTKEELKLTQDAYESIKDMYAIQTETNAHLEGRLTQVAFREKEYESRLNALEIQVKKERAKGKTKAWYTGMIMSFVGVVAFSVLK